MDTYSIDYASGALFSFIKEGGPNNVFNTPPRFTLNDQEKETNPFPSDECVSFCGGSGNKFIFEVQSFNQKNDEEEYFIKKDLDFQSKIQSDVDEKTKGLRNILGKLGTSLDRLRGEVDSFIHPNQNQIRDVIRSKIQSKIVQSQLGNDSVQEGKENNQESHITTTVLFEAPPLNTIFGSKHIERSCTKSCSKVKSQIKKYQNNKQFQSFKNLLKEISFSESNKKSRSSENTQQIVSLKLDDYEINARRRLDFDALDEEFDDQPIFESQDELSNDTISITSNNNNNVESDSTQNEKMESESSERDSDHFYQDNSDIKPPIKKIFIKDIDRSEGNNINYYYIYRTHH